MKKLQSEICVSFEESSKRLSVLCSWSCGPRMVAILWVDRRSRSSAHKIRLQKLSTLLDRKAAVEENILANSRKLEKAFLAANQELRVVFGARYKDIEGNSSQPKRDIDPQWSLTMFWSNHRSHTVQGQSSGTPDRKLPLLRRELSCAGYYGTM